MSTAAAAEEPVAAPPRRAGIDFLECVSRRTGLPRWLVGVVLTVALLVTVWLTASFLLALAPAVSDGSAVFCGSLFTLHTLKAGHFRTSVTLLASCNLVMHVVELHW